MIAELIVTLLATGAVAVAISPKAARWLSVLLMAQADAVDAFGYVFSQSRQSNSRLLESGSSIRDRYQAVSLQPSTTDSDE